MPKSGSIADALTWYDPFQSDSPALTHASNQALLSGLDLADFDGWVLVRVAG